MINLHHQVFGRKYAGVASIPFSNTKLIVLPISTRSGNCVINWGDGTTQNFTPSKNIDVISGYATEISHTYSTAYTGNVDITFYNGLADVYSLFLHIPQSFTPESNSFNIQDFNTFINQFSNLYSLRISSNAVFNFVQKCNIKGNVADVPSSVERIELGHMGALVNPNELYLDVTNFKVGSQLKWLNRNMASLGANIATTWQTYGNLAKLPSQLYYFKLDGNAGTFTYSGTKVWASSFDTLDLGGSTMASADVDRLYNSMKLHITSAIGSKVINPKGNFSIEGYDGYKYLKNLGFTINNSVCIGGSLNLLSATETIFNPPILSTAIFTYTAGRTWASSFDTLDLGNASLSPSETDNLFNDMANSITTAIGGKIIRLVNCYRTLASNPAVAYLQSLGYVITVAGITAPANSKILDLPLQNNFTDTTGINTIIAGGTSNLPTFTLEGGEYAATFNGSQSLKTNANFNLNSDKVSISFWLKTSQTAIAIIAELSSVFDNNNAFAAYINSPSNRITMADHTTIYNRTSGSTIINNNNWHHVVLIIDRGLGTSQTSVYINNILVTVVDSSGDLNGNFGLFPLFIGQRAGSTTGFNGQLKFLKIYNYHLSQTERTNLFNKTM